MWINKAGKLTDMDLKLAFYANFVMQKKNQWIFSIDFRIAFQKFSEIRFFDENGGKMLNLKVRT